ncbi:hypothetical protein ACFL6U_28100 [Planctomycetota bacterium]
MNIGTPNRIVTGSFEQDCYKLHNLTALCLKDCYVQKAFRFTQFFTVLMQNILQSVIVLIIIPQWSLTVEHGTLNTALPAVNDYK